MVFTSPFGLAQFREEVPDSVPLEEFVLGAHTRLPPSSTSGYKAPFLDVVSGTAYSAETLAQRVDWLSRALARDLGWAPDVGTPWDKVVAICSLNTIDYLVLCWAVHRLNGICLLLHSTSTVAEITAHAAKARCSALFTNQQLAATSTEAADALSIPHDRIFAFALPDDDGNEPTKHDQFKTVDKMMTEGKGLEPLQRSRWGAGQARTQVAFLCPTSGTTGTQKLAMITHYGLAMNVAQATVPDDEGGRRKTEVGLWALPLSHSYGVLIGHLTAYRGDQIVILPRFDMQRMLRAIAQHRVETLWLIPSIITAMAANPFLFQLCDLSSVRSVFTAAAPLGRELVDKLLAYQPNWLLRQSYGLTETSVVVSWTRAHDVWSGSSGCLVPGYELKLVGADGEEVCGHNEAGELFFRGPSFFIGYLGDEEATRTTLVGDGWLRTGDVGLVRKGPSGAEHIVIKDRIKDMIKVKGNQVIPADIEAVLLTHPAIVEAAVVGVPDELSGERPHAFVVVRQEELARDHGDDKEELCDSIDELVESKFDETHWLHGRITVLHELPRNQSGKVLKRELRAISVAA